VAQQTSIAMTHADEQLFLEFLRGISEIQIFESFAPTKEALWVGEFAQIFRDHWSCSIWIKAKGCK